MGGKSSSSNDQMVRFQKQQAREARKKEEERQARLNQGTEAINSEWSKLDPNLYTNYQNSLLDYQMPQLEQQYGAARDKLTYDLARAGLLRSKAAGQAQRRLGTENFVNEAGLRAQADRSVADLRNTFQNQQSQALNQLYATEDPTAAANLATSQVANANMTQPNLEPLGALFSPIAVGGIAALDQGYTNSLQNSGYLRGKSYLDSSGKVVPT